MSQQQKTLASSIHVCVNSGHIYLSRSISFAKAPEESRVAVSTTKANYRVMPASFFFLKAAPYSDIPYRMTEKRPSLRIEVAETEVRMSWCWEKMLFR